MLALKDIIGYLHYYAYRFESDEFEHWELINEAWIVVHELNCIEFASQGIRWAMMEYRRRERRHRHHGNPAARILPLYTDVGMNLLVTNMMCASTKHTTDQVDNADMISWLSNNACLSLDERLLLDCRFKRQMSFKEIACMRGCTHQHISLRMKRIITMLSCAAIRLERKELLVYTRQTN